MVTSIVRAYIVMRVSLLNFIRTVEGGAGQGKTYCAPQKGSVLGSLWKWPISFRSEQDIQGTAQSVLRKSVASNANSSDIFSFHFKTEWVDFADSSGARIEWYDDVGAEFADTYQKRSFEPKHFVIDEIHANKTIKSHRYRLRLVC